MATVRTSLDRPEFIKDEYLDFLDELFESYALDMERAGPLLCSEFRLGSTEALETLRFWTRTFGRRF